MNEILQIAIGVFTGALIVVVPGFAVSIAQTKKSIKAGPRILSYTGELRLTPKEYVVIFVLSWVLAVAVGAIAATGLSAAGQTDIMKWSLIAAGIASYALSKKLLKTRVYANYNASSNEA